MKPYYDEDGITIYCGDCLEVMDGIAERCDAFVTDPPFAFAGGLSNGRSSQVDDQFFAYWWRDVCGKLTALCGEAGSGFIWCDWRTVSSFAAGFAPKSQTYDYYRMTQMIHHYREMPGQGMPFRNSVDMIAYVRGPKHKDPPIPNTTHNFISSYWYYGKHEYHPAEKCLKIAEQLIEWAGGQTVIDPFMGSGTTLAAAREKGRRAIGIEIEEKYCEIAAERLRQRSLFAAV